jgi:hypothetical protein
MNAGWHSAQAVKMVREPSKMPKVYDATLKGMLETSPEGWIRLIGYGAPKASVIDADVSTYTGAADKVIRVQEDPSWLMHVEFQASRDASLPGRMHLYNALLDNRHDCLVRTAVVLLRPTADNPA